MAVKVDPASLKRLENVISDNGTSYVENISKMKGVVDQILSGDFKGDAADNFKTLYEQKETFFRQIAETIDEAAEYLGLQNKEFGTMMDELIASMK